MRARPVRPGTTYLLTRRAAARLLLLTPTKDVKAITRYALFRAARKAKLLVHAAIFSSNHFHLVVTDPKQNLPTFMQDMNSLIARALNAHWERQGEHFWSPGTYSRVDLLDADSVWDRLLYTTANAVKDGLVSSPDKWPGFVLLPKHMGISLRARRPRTAFFTRSKLPEHEDLTPALPPLLEAAGYDMASFVREFTRRLSAYVAALREEHEGPYMGAARVKRQSPFTSAGPVRSSSSSTRVFFAVEGAARKDQEQKERAWLRAYREARAVWPQPEPDVLFPSGTYLVHVTYGAKVAS